MRLAWIVAVVIGCGSPRAPSSSSSSGGALGAPASCGAALPATPPAQASQLLQTSHAATVTGMATSADGYLATTSQFDHTIRIWDLARRALVTVLPMEALFEWDDDAHALVLAGRAKTQHGMLSDDLVISADGHELAPRPGTFGTHLRLFVGGKSRPAAITIADRVATYDDGARVHHVPLPAAGADTLYVVAGGHEIVARAFDQIVRWSLDVEPAVAVERTVGAMTDAAFTDAGEAVVMLELAGAWRLVVVPRAATAPVRTLLEGSPDTIVDVPKLAASRDGKIAVVSRDEGLAAIEVATGHGLWSERGYRYDPTRDRGPEVRFGHVAIANDDRTLIAARGDGELVLRDLATGRPLGSLGAPVHRPDEVAWVDEHHVVAADRGRVAVWDTTRGTIASAFTESRGFLTTTVIAGDVVVGRMTLCFHGNDHATTGVWVDRWTGGEPPAELVAGKAPPLRDGCAAPTATATWPPDRGMARSAMEVGVGQLFDLHAGVAAVSTGKGFFSLSDAARNFDGSVHPLANFPKREPLVQIVRGGFAFASVANAVAVWRTTDGTRLADLSFLGGYDGKRAITTILAVSDDGARVALHDGGHVVVFDAATANQIADVRLPDSFPTAVIFADDPHDLWFGTETGAIFHATAAGIEARGAAAATKIAHLARSPSGDRLAAAGDDGGLRIIDAKTGALVATFVEFADDEPIAFTPGGAYGGTAEAADRVGWKFGAPLEVFRFEQFAKTFHQPALVAARLGGKPDDVTAGLVRPPTVTLTAPPAATVATPTVHVEIAFASGRRVDVVRAYREGREVAAAAPCAATGKVALDVPLLDGGNAIAVQAFDDLGYASNAATARVVRSGGARPELHVVAVGVGAYPKLADTFQLPLATADAKAIAAAFAPDVGAGKRFAAIHPTVLLDAQATVPAILAALDGLAAMSPDDLAIVFLAGHGVLPSPDDDMVFATGGATLDPASLRANGIAWPEVAQKLARAKGRVIVLLDACHSGHVSQNLVVPNDRLAAALAGEGRAGVVVFAAAKGRQSSYEPNGVRGFALGPQVAPLVTGLGGDHGYFTGALLAALRDPKSDRDGDGVVEMSEWIAATRDRVTRATEGLQTPWVARQEVFGDFGVARVTP